MPRKKTKTAKTPQNRTHTKAPLPLSALLVKEKFQQLQLAALARSLQPVEHPAYDLKNALGVIEFSHWLIDARLERKIGVDDLVGMTRVCDMLLRYYSPSSLTIVQGNLGDLRFQGVKIERASQVDDIVRQGGLAYAAAIDAEPTSETVRGSGG